MLTIYRQLQSYLGEGSESKTHNIIHAIKNRFPCSYGSAEEKFTFYPFSNEIGFPKILQTLNACPVKKTGQVRVAILFGESNFLSMLPELSIHAELILLADIEPRLHKHNKILLEAFEKANDIKTFNDLYPAIYSKNFGNINAAITSDIQSRSVRELLDERKKSLGEYHFLANQKRFEKCKEAYKKVLLQRIVFDLLSPKDCHHLAEILRQEHGVITVCNFTNIHNYDNEFSYQEDGEVVFHTQIEHIATTLLLNDSRDAFIIFSEPVLALQNKFSHGLDHFLKTGLKEQMLRMAWHKENNTINHKIDLLNNCFRSLLKNYDIPVEKLPKIVFSTKRPLFYDDKFVNFDRKINLENLSTILELIQGVDVAARDENLHQLVNVLNDLHEYFENFPRIKNKSDRLEVNKLLRLQIDQLDKLLHCFNSHEKVYPLTMMSHMAANTIQFWLKRTRDENKALKITDRAHSPLAKKIIERRICK